MANTAKVYSFQEALARLQNICSRSEKCAYDLTLKLQKWGVSAADSSKIVDSLRSSNFINDERYIRAYVQEKITISKWGQQKVTRMLKAKQLPVDLIEEVVSGINSEKYKEDLYNLLKKKNLQLKDESTYSRKGKLLRFALSRGYEYELAFDLLSSKDFYKNKTNLRYC